LDQITVVNDKIKSNNQDVERIIREKMLLKETNDKDVKQKLLKQLMKFNDAILGDKLKKRIKKFCDFKVKNNEELS